MAAARPGWAGLFGALACKPQLAIQVAPLLLFTRDWRAIGASLAVSVILVGASLLLWGAEAWLAFFESSSLPRRFMEEGGKVYACRFALQALYGHGEHALIPGIKPVSPLDVLDIQLLHRRDNAFVVHSWTL